MKRFERLERPRASPGDASDAQKPSVVGPEAQRFSAIGRAESPPTAPAPPLQLALHDRYSELADETRRARQDRAAEALARKQAEIAAQATPHHAPGALDLVVRGVGVGPLARLGAMARLGLVGGSILALWLGVNFAIGGVAALVTVAAVMGLLVALGLRPPRS